MDTTHLGTDDREATVSGEGDGEVDQQVGVVEGEKPGEDGNESGDGDRADTVEEGMEDDVVVEEAVEQEKMAGVDRDSQHACSDEGADASDEIGRAHV